MILELPLNSIYNLLYMVTVMYVSRYSSFLRYFVVIL